MKNQLQLKMIVKLGYGCRIVSNLLNYQVHTISGFSGSNFCEIPVVVALHLEVEYFTLGITSLRDQVLIKESL